MQITSAILENLVKKYFTDSPAAQKVWQFLETNPVFISEISEEIDAAIILFSKYKDKKEIGSYNIPLINALHLKDILKDDLPSVAMLITIIENYDDAELLENIMKEMSKFEFIDTVQPVEKCAAALLLGAYRSAILILYPYLRENNAQVASTLEEMLALMALDGKKTILFETVRH